MQRLWRSIFHTILTVSLVLDLVDAPYVDEILEALNQQSPSIAQIQAVTESDGADQAYLLKADQDSLALYTQLLANNLPLVTDHQPPVMEALIGGAPTTAVESAIALTNTGASNVLQDTHTASFDISVGSGRALVSNCFV